MPNVPKSLVSETIVIDDLMALCGALAPIRDAAGPADRETLQRASDLLALMGGMLYGLESRLMGDMEQVPEKALTGIVMQHYGDDPAAFNAALALARDVRLLCFFQAIERSATS